MASSNVYYAEPAEPLLAHSLLARPMRPIDTEQPIEKPMNTNDWVLKDDLDMGIQSFKSCILHCGSVIGFSRLRSRSNNNDEYIGQV